MQTLLYRMDKQQGPLYITRNYIQYPMIYHNGKENEKEYIYMYLYVCIYIYIYIYIYICITKSFAVQ